MKRPYIRLKVRLAVAERQAKELPVHWWNFYDRIKVGKSLSARIDIILADLFVGDDIELDHDPALELRKFNARTGRYTPDANNPKFLVYRYKPDHLEKTYGRKPGAERTVTTKGSDLWLAKKFRKLENPKKAKRKIQSRPFPKQQRGFKAGHGKALRGKAGLGGAGHGAARRDKAGRGLARQGKV